MPHSPLRCRPAAFYYRRAIHESTDLEGLKRIALWLVKELEFRNEQIRDLGEIPRRLYEPSSIGPNGVILEEDDLQTG